MESIDVHDLPDAVAQAIAETVQTLREQFNKNGKRGTNGLPLFDLGAKGRLGRDEIYHDHLDRKFDAHPS